MLPGHRASGMPDLLPACGPVASPPRLPSSGLEVWYDFRGSLTNLVDLSGHGVDGIGVALGAGVNDAGQCQAAEFDGTSSHVQLGSPEVGRPLWMGEAAQSWEFWFMYQDSAAYRMLFSVESGLVYVRFKLTDHMSCVDGTHFNDFLDNVVLADAWTHVVFVVEDGVQPKQYLNGALAEVADSVHIGSVTGGSVYLGVEQDGAGQYFKGLMGCFRAYSYALSAAEIAALFAAERGWYGV